jgi:hypothetical protein
MQQKGLPDVKKKKKKKKKKRERERKKVRASQFVTIKTFGKDRVS